MIAYLGENKLLTLVLVVPLVLAFIAGIAIGAKGPSRQTSRGGAVFSGCLHEVLGIAWFFAVMYAVADGGLPDLGKFGIWYGLFYLISLGVLQVLVLLGLYSLGRYGGWAFYRFKTGKWGGSDDEA